MVVSETRNTTTTVSFETSSFSALAINTNTKTNTPTKQKIKSHGMSTKSRIVFTKPFPLQFQWNMMHKDTGKWQNVESMHFYDLPSIQPKLDPLLPQSCFLKVHKKLLLKRYTSLLKVQKNTYYCGEYTEICPSKQKWHSNVYHEKN